LADLQTDFHPAGIREMRKERLGHPVEADHRPHLAAAIDWLVRAQDATGDAGIARGYSVTPNRFLGPPGWQASYPETTGYIIPTLLAAAEYLEQPDLADRAFRAAAWESAIQLESGAVQGGIIGQGRHPAVFNTGQVILGWLAAHKRTGDVRFESSVRRAGEYLVAVMEPDGHWRKGNSPFALSKGTLYNARVAWALLEAGAHLDVPAFTKSGALNLRGVAERQQANGWFPGCCLSDPSRPLLHTIAYTIRGLLEGARILEDDVLLEAASKAAGELAERVREDGWMSGRFRSDWSAAVKWSCLTGQAQMANNWMRLYQITGEDRWLAPVPQVLRFLKRTQNRSSTDPGLRGGIKGSFPMNSEYGRFEVLSWATKFFADALMRQEQIAQQRGVRYTNDFVLA
jgi:hypothetical protein